MLGGSDSLGANDGATFLTTIHAHLNQPIDQARANLRRVAGEQQWALAVGETDPDTLEFRQGVAPHAGASTVNVRLQPASATKTNLEFTTHDPFALRHRGKGSQNIRAILTALGAVKD